MAKSNRHTTQSSVTDWLKLGSEVTGSAFGALIGTYFMGSEGAVIGASITPLINETISKIGSDFKNMIFSKREEIRIGATFTYALSKIKQRLEAGEKPRQDNFFTEERGKRPASEEILEAALRLAQKEHEELKIKHYGYLIANIYFDNSIDRGYANLLLSIADRLSYQKLLLLEIFNNTSKLGLDKNKFHRKIPRRQNIVRGIDLSLYSSENYDLRGLLKRRKIDLHIEIDELESYHLIDKNIGLPVQLGENFAHVVLTEIGSLLRQLMELKDLDSTDLQEVANIL